MMLGLSQGTYEAVVAEDEDSNWNDEAQWCGHDVVGHLQSAVANQSAVIEHVVARRGLAVRRRADEGGRPRPERGQLDQHGNDERSDDSQTGGGDADQIASVQWTTDDHVSAHSDRQLRSREEKHEETTSSRTD